MNGRTTDDLVRIVANGGGVRISAKVYGVADLVRIVANGGNKKPRITIFDTDVLAVNDLVQIAANGGGMVSFE